MLTFGYENRFSGPLKAVLAIAFGVFLIATKANAMTLVVQIIAVSILVFGIFSFFVGLKHSKENSLQMLIVNAIVNIVMALLIFLFADAISAVVRYLLGTILFLFGLYQVVALFSARKLLSGGFLPFVFPIVVMLAGAMFFSKELIGQDIFGLIAGIAFIMYGVSEVIATVKMAQAISEVEKTTARPEPENQETQLIESESVKDVEYKEVDK